MVTVILRHKRRPKGEPEPRRSKALIQNAAEPYTEFILVDFDKRTVDGYSKLADVPLDAEERTNVVKYIGDQA
jgi:hypothetical protein